MEMARVICLGFPCWSLEFGVGLARVRASVENASWDLGLQCGFLELCAELTLKHSDSRRSGGAKHSPSHRLFQNPHNAEHTRQGIVA